MRTPAITTSILLILITLLHGCKKDDIDPDPDINPHEGSGYARFRINGVSVDAGTIGSGLVQPLGDVYIYSGAVSNGHWTLSLGGGFPDTCSTPLTVSLSSDPDGANISLWHWPDYPAPTNTVSYANWGGTSGTITFTQLDRTAGGRISATFDLQGLEASDDDLNVISTNNTLSGEFSVRIED